MIAKFTMHFRFQSPLFCYVLVVGTILGFVSVLVSIPEPTDILCTVAPWLWGIESFLCLQLSSF